MKSRVLLGCGMGALAFAGCSSESARAFDLPAGWTHAQLVKTFSQGECAASAYDPNLHEAIDVTAGVGSVHIAYHNAHFRCSQAVEGFVLAGTDAFDVLVQPIDMNPSMVAKCDCLYEITLALDASPGTYAARVYRRWDHKSGSDGVTPVGSGSVEVCRAGETSKSVCVACGSLGGCGETERACTRACTTNDDCVGVTAGDKCFGGVCGPVMGCI